MTDPNSAFDTLMLHRGGKTSAPLADDMRVKSFWTAQDDVCLHRIISLTNSAERVEVGVLTENMTGSKDTARCLLYLQF